MPHEYFGRPEAAKRKPTGRRIPCRSRLSLWEWQSFRSYPFSRDSRGSSAHPTIPPQVSCCPWTSTRGRPWRHPSLRSVSRWNRGFECRASRIAVRHVFPAAMNNGGGIFILASLDERLDLSDNSDLPCSFSQFIQRYNVERVIPHRRAVFVTEPVSTYSSSHFWRIRISSFMQRRYGLRFANEKKKCSVSIDTLQLNTTPLFSHLLNTSLSIYTLLRSHS